MSIFTHRTRSAWAAAFLGSTIGSAAAAVARQPADLVGTWDLTFDGTGAICRVMLRAQRSDKGDFFLGMPTACRHAMPGIAAVGRWSMPDAGHVALGDPGGTPLVVLDATGDGFVGRGPSGTYALKPLPPRTATAEPAPGQVMAASMVPTPVVQSSMAATSPAQVPLSIERIATKRSRAPASEPPDTKTDLTGRYAVMREKRDTGCMLTLDKTRSTGGDRAQLAPGCRDQGIVIFEPSAWQLVKGELVLTARAGHKTRLEKQGEGLWAKDPKEGGKPLGLKKL